MTYQYAGNGRKALTHMELLVVIAMIGLFIGLLLPAVNESIPANACSQKPRNVKKYVPRCPGAKQLPSRFRRRR
jgi:hypothetical protein